MLASKLAIDLTIGLIWGNLSILQMLIYALGLSSALCPARALQLRFCAAVSSSLPEYKRTRAVSTS